MASPSAVMLDISVADFGDNDAERVTLAKALAAKAADRIK